MSWFGDFLGGPEVETSFSNAGNVGSIPGLGAKISHALGPKKHKTHKNKSNIVTNSIKTSKLVHNKKNLEKKNSLCL